MNDEENVVYAFHKYGILFSLDTEGNPAICKNMDELEDIMLSE